jgi:UDP-4-amino-4,6-dideoxy-N-acetyl-beta-L-altrosamine N-acetyltransferase
MTELKFRRISEGDLDQLRAWRTSPAVTKYLLSDPIITAESQRKWWDSVKDHTTYKCWIVNVDGTDAGYCDLASFDAVNRKADPGIYIGNEEFRGQGLARHVMLNQQRHAFEHFGLNKLYGPVMAANSATIAAVLRVGFVLEGYLHDYVYKNDRYWDVVMIGLLRERWEKFGKNEEYIKGTFED